VHVHVISWVNHAKYAIRILLAAPQEYMNGYLTMMFKNRRVNCVYAVRVGLTLEPPYPPPRNCVNAIRTSIFGQRSISYVGSLHVEQVFTYSWDAATRVRIAYSAWSTLYMTWICAYSKILYSYNRLQMNRIPYVILPPRIQHVG